MASPPLLTRGFAPRGSMPLMDSGVMTLVGRQELHGIAGAIFTKAGSNAIVPPSVPWLRSLTSTSVARTVPAIARLAATVKIANLFMSRPFWMDFPELWAFGMSISSSAWREFEPAQRPGGFPGYQWHQHCGWPRRIVSARIERELKWPRSTVPWS